LDTIKEDKNTKGVGIVQEIQESWRGHSVDRTFVLSGGIFSEVCTSIWLLKGSDSLQCFHNQTD